MSVVELHPEELLDRETSGELTAVERVRLEAHLGSCKVCRFERQVRLDFSRDDEPLEADFDVQRLLSEVLAPGTERQLVRASGAASKRKNRKGASRFGRRLRPVLLAAASVCMAGAAAAAGWSGLHVWHPNTNALVGVSASAAAGAGGMASIPGAVTPPLHSVRAPDLAVSPASEPLTAPLPVVFVPPVQATASEDRGGTRPSEAAPHAQRALQTAPGPSSIVPRAAEPVDSPGTIEAARPASVTPESSSDAATLFVRANDARRAGDHGRALTLYRRLLTSYPASAEAHAAQAAMGRLLLDDGDAASALPVFEGYLTTGGPLREDVMADRALALGRLGRTRDEAAAWSALLEAYPGSVHATRARAKLAELGAP